MLYLCSTRKGLNNTLKVNYGTGKKISHQSLGQRLGDLGHRRQKGHGMLLAFSRSGVPVQTDGVELGPDEVSQKLLTCNKKSYNYECFDYY